MLRRAGLCHLRPAVVRRIIPGRFHEARATGFACRLVHAESRQPWRFGHAAGIGLTGIREQRWPEAASATGSRQRALRHGIQADARVDRKMSCCGESAGMPAGQGPSRRRIITAGATYSRQQTRETRRSRLAVPGQPVIVDYEYERNGTANLFMVFAPLLGWRWVKVTDRRTRSDWALLIRELVDEVLPGKKLVQVMDKLNIYAPCSLYEAFEPAEARRILERLEIHYTPKHCSWRNIAEIEIGVLSRQCLAWRIPDREFM